MKHNDSYLAQRGLLFFGNRRRACIGHRLLRLGQLLVHICELRHRICSVLESFRLKQWFVGQGKITHRDQWTLTQGIYPIFVPEQTQELGVQTGFENLHLKRIILVGMDTKVFNLVKRDRLVLGGYGIWGRVVVRVRAEGANVDFAGRDSAVGIDLQQSSANNKWSEGSRETHHNGDERVLVFLVDHLSVDVDTREPASVAGV